MANAAFERKDTQVLGISTDAAPTQTAFASSIGGLPYPLLGDFHPKGSVAQLFGIYNDDRGTSNRAIIIIDKEGVVRYVRTYESMAGLSPEAVLEEVDKL